MKTTVVRTGPFATKASVKTRRVYRETARNIGGRKCRKLKRRPDTTVTKYVPHGGPHRREGSRKRPQGCKGPSPPPTSRRRRRNEPRHGASALTVGPSVRPRHLPVAGSYPTEDPQSTWSSRYSRRGCRGSGAAPRSPPEVPAGARSPVSERGRWRGGVRHSSGTGGPRERTVQGERLLPGSEKTPCSTTKHHV